MPHNLISAQDSPVPLPKFQMAPRLKILMSSGSKKGTQIYHPFHSKSPNKQIPSRFPTGAPMDRDTCLQGIFMTLLIYLSMFPNRVPMDRITPSPEPLVYLFIHPFTYVCWSSQKGALLHMGKNIRSPYTKPHADGRPHTMGCGLVPRRTCGVNHTPFPLTIIAQTLPYNREQKFDCVYLGFLPLMAGL